MVAGGEEVFCFAGNTGRVDDIADGDGIIIFFTEVIVDGFDGNT